MVIFRFIKKYFGIRKARRERLRNSNPYWEMNFCKRKRYKSYLRSQGVKVIE